MIYKIFFKQYIIDQKGLGEKNFYNGIIYDGNYEFTVNAHDEDDALHKVLNYFYENYWCNNLGISEDKIKIPDELIDKLSINLIDSIKRELRDCLGVDKYSVEEFNKLCLNKKITYLNDIECSFDYFVIPSKIKFNKINV